jgi:hypothetical protein
MAQQNRSTIKTFFETGDIPTEAQFGDSFDSQVFWQDDVETTLGTTDTKVPTSKAVNDAMVYTKDSHDNVFYKGVTATLDGNNNIFHQGAVGNVFGTTTRFNIIEQFCSGFTFGNGLEYTTIKSGSVGADYTATPDFDFLYNNDYPSEIFRNAEGTANYHRYYDPTNDRIVLTLLASPFTVSYIGGGGGGGDVYLANDQTFTGENTFAIGSGSKEPIIVTKGGNGAGIKVTKSSGSGDAIEVAEGSLSIADETASTIASFDGSKRIKSLATSTYPSLTELALVKGVTGSAIQTQLDSKRKTIQSAALGTAVTGTTSNTYCKGIEIPAGWFVDGDCPMCNAGVIKTGTAGTLSIRMYLNTTNNLSGSPILVGSVAGGVLAASTLGQNMQRAMAIIKADGSGSGTRVTNTSANQVNDFSTRTAANTTLTPNFTTTTYYFIIALQNGSSADSSNCEFISIN